MTNLFNYIERKSPIHELSGATKLICLLLWSFAAMITFDTRMLVFLPVVSIFAFSVSKIRIKDISFIFYFMLVFLVLNNLLIFLFEPEQGVKIYGTRHVLFEIFGRYVVTSEQLFYHLNVILKFFATIPIVLLFVCTTNPSEFASSLARVGVNYKIAYAVSLALRYIPDIQREYHDISLSQQARGLEMSKKQKLTKRLISAVKIVFPLIMSSMERIEVISNAMELRGFGKNKKRSWYTGEKFRRADYLCMGFCLLLLLVSIGLNFLNHGRYFNPFI